MKVSDAYKRNMLFNTYYAKRRVTGKLVAVLDGTYENCDLLLVEQPAYVLRSGDIHELIITDEAAQPGATVKTIAYLVFFEIITGGVIVAGDEVHIKGKIAGKIAGYEETHMPNHVNIVLTGVKISGRGLGLTLEEEVVIG
jgi:hypothetical protein